MTPVEHQEIADWFATVRNAMPTGTLALLFYERDGAVYVGRGEDAHVEMHQFNLYNLPQVMQLASMALGDIYDKGVPDADE